jgi:hypothetical protein
LSCYRVSVACPGISRALLATVRVRPATVAARGLVAFFSGGQGVSFWGKNEPAVTTWFASLQQRGLMIAEVEWAAPGWLGSAPGEQVGPAALACRPATLVRWIHDALYARLGLGDLPRVCGFCITGNSGGATQVSYVLSHFGLDSLLGGVFPTSGPPHTALSGACLGDPSYSYQGSGATDIIDQSYGYPQAGTGPCTKANASFSPYWDRDSIETRGADYYHPNTRIALLLGSRDPRMLPHARAYDDRLVASGTDAPIVVVPNVGHEMPEDASGRAAIAQQLLSG